MILEKLLGIAHAVAETAGEAAPVAAEAAAATGEPVEMTAGQTAISYLLTFLPIILMFVVFYFLLIRPQRKKDKKVKDMLAALKPGDRICTIGGIYGTITGIRDDTITLSVGRDNLSMVVARWAIRNVEDVQIENDAEALN